MREQILLIRERKKVAQERQKSYVEHRRRSIEFEVGHWVYIKVSPMKWVIHFEKKRKLSPRYVRPYEIVERVGLAAYTLDLLAEFLGIHNVFHVSSFKKSFGCIFP